MKIKFTLNGFEPELSIIKTKDNYSSTYIISLFYPYRLLKIKLYNLKIKKYLNKLGYPLIKCQGCGQGYAEWKIINTNDKFDKSSSKVCNHCVDLYNWNFSKLRLEIIWRQEEDGNLYRNR